MEFSKFEVFVIFLIENFWNISSWKFSDLTKLENQQILKKFNFSK